MRLGPGLLYEGRTLQGARPKLADFCSATMAEFYSAVDKFRFLTDTYRDNPNIPSISGFLRHALYVLFFKKKKHWDIGIC